MLLLQEEPETPYYCTVSIHLKLVFVIFFLNQLHFLIAFSRKTYVLTQVWTVPSFQVVASAMGAFFKLRRVLHYGCLCSVPHLRYGEGGSNLKKLPTLFRH